MQVRHMAPSLKLGGRLGSVNAVQCVKGIADMAINKKGLTGLICYERNIRIEKIDGYFQALNMHYTRTHIIQVFLRSNPIRGTIGPRELIV